MTTEDRINDVNSLPYDAVGPTIRSGEIADAVIDAVAEDNPKQMVYVVDRGDYLHVNTLKECKLTKASMEKFLGRSYDLSMLEIEMPSFSGRMRSSAAEFVWYLNH